MNLCIYMYMNTYTYIYIYIHTYIHIWLWAKTVDSASCMSLLCNSIVHVLTPNPKSSYPTPALNPKTRTPKPRNPKFLNDYYYYYVTILLLINK